MQRIERNALTTVGGGMWGGGSSGGIPQLACGDIQVSFGTGGVNLQATFSQLAACWRQLTGGDEPVPMYSELYWQGQAEAGHDFGEDYSGQGWTVG